MKNRYPFFVDNQGPLAYCLDVYMVIMVLNSGSSSIKFQCIETEEDYILCKGQVERIGLQDGSFHLTSWSGKTGEKEEEAKTVFLADHRAGIALIKDSIPNPKKVDALGHRMIHGGETITGAKLLTPEVISLIHLHDTLAPLHNPPTIMGVEAAQSFFPKIPHVGVFDTAFHSTLPEESFVYGLNYSLYEKHGIRRYGYHGPSHQYVTMKAAEFLNIPVETFNCVSCHLGNGVSLTAVRSGESVDTSLGFGTMCGVPMGTRAGDFDPDIVLYLMDSLGMTSAEVKDLIYKDSGLKGLSGISNDVRDINEAAARGNKRARLALRVFAHAARKFIAAMATNLEGRMDALIFTAGIGENEPAVRSRICRGLEIMGIELDEDKNARNEECISTSASKVRVLVIPTDEERMIALETKRIVESLGEPS